MNPAVKWAIRLAVIPVAIASYITVAGLTGFCPSCKAVVDGIRGLHEPMTRPASAAASLAGLTGVSLEGEVVPLETAGKPMIIELWATWCGPCHRQRGIIKEMGEELSSRATLVAMSVDTDPRAVTKFLAEKPSGMLELMAPPETLVAFGGVTAVPTLVFVDASGAIRGVASGVHSASLLKTRVAELLAAPATTN